MKANIVIAKKMPLKQKVFVAYNNILLHQKLNRLHKRKILHAVMMHEGHFNSYRSLCIDNFIKETHLFRTNIRSL